MAIHPRNKQNVETGNYQLGKYRIYNKHGADLYGNSHDFVAEKTSKHWGERSSQAHMYLFQVFTKIAAIEAQHKDKLETLAKKIVSEVWGCDHNILDAHITTDQNEIDVVDNNREMPEPDEQQSKHINHRILMNQLTQAAAVHQYMTLHHLAEQALAEISPELVQLYDKLVTSTMSSYWIMDIESMLEDLGAHRAGSAKIETIGDEVTVKAAAMCFPVLCQELSKGLMTLATQHGINNLDQQTAEMTIHYADKLNFEPWQIKMGPAIWQRFLKVVPANLAAQVTAKLSMEDPDYAEEIIETILENPEKAKALLKNYVEMPLKNKREHE